ncbi:MAG: three-Cys-motif partner protein TcmP [Bacteroidota bacterium]
MDDFFEEQRLASRIKSELVTKYFMAWANIMKKRTPCGLIGYVDLFSGPGRYKDGSPSTPLMILEEVLRQPDISSKLVMLFNDKEQTYVDQLKKEISGFPGIDVLKYPPAGVLFGN